jgi:serine/threonine protein kinase
VIHRDIKPENVLLGSGHALVSDFGIARAISEAEVGETTAGHILGTPDYMSPEQISRDGDLDGRTDIYSLGMPALRGTGRETSLRRAHGAIGHAAPAGGPCPVVAKR